MIGDSADDTGPDRLMREDITGPSDVDDLPARPAMAQYSRLGVSTESAISFQQHFATRMLMELGDPQSDLVSVRLGGEELIEDVVAEYPHNRFERIQVKQVLREDRNWTISRLGEPSVDFWRRAYDLHGQHPDWTFVLATDGTCNADLLFVRDVFPTKCQGVDDGAGAWEPKEANILTDIAEECDCSRSEVETFLQRVELRTKQPAYEDLERTNIDYARVTLGLPASGYYRLFSWVCGESLGRPRIGREDFRELMDELFGTSLTVDETVLSPSEYVRREVLEDQIEAAVERGRRIVVAEGQVGAGKTSTLSHLAERNEWPAHFVQRGATRDPIRMQLTEALVGLIGRMRDLGWDAAPVRVGMQDRDIRTAFERTLERRAGAVDRAVILVDGIDETTTVRGDQEILDYLASVRMPPSVTLVIGLRPGVLSADLPHVEFITVAPLTVDETAAIVRTRLPRAPHTLIARLHAKAEGNPLYVCLFLDAVGEQCDLDGALSTAASGLVAYVQQSLRDIARDETALGFLRVLALTRHELDERTVAQVLDVSPLQLQAVLTANVRALLQPDCWLLAHSAIRETIEDDLPDAEECQLHRRLANAFYALPPERMERTEVAAHLLAAGERSLLRERVSPERLGKRLDTEGWLAVEADIIAAVGDCKNMDEVMELLPALSTLDCMRRLTEERCSPDVIRYAYEQLGWEHVERILLQSTAIPQIRPAVQLLLREADELGELQRAFLQDVTECATSTVLRLFASEWNHARLIPGLRPYSFLDSETVIERICSLRDLSELNRLIDEYAQRSAVLLREDVEAIVSSLSERDLNPHDMISVISVRARFLERSSEELLETCRQTVELADEETAVDAGELLIAIAGWLLDEELMEAAERVFRDAIETFSQADDGAVSVVRQCVNMQHYDWSEDWLRAWLSRVIEFTQNMPPSWERLQAVQRISELESDLGQALTFSRDYVLETMRHIPSLGTDTAGHDFFRLQFEIRELMVGEKGIVKPDDKEAFLTVERFIAGADLSRLGGRLAWDHARELDDALAILASHYHEMGWTEDEERVLQRFRLDDAKGHYLCKQLQDTWADLAFHEVHREYLEMEQSGFEGFSSLDISSLRRSFFQKAVSGETLPPNLAHLPLEMAQHHSSSEDIIIALAENWGEDPAAWGGECVKDALLEWACGQAARAKRLAVLQSIAPTIGDEDAATLTEELIVSTRGLYVHGLDMADTHVSRAVARLSPQCAMEHESWLMRCWAGASPLPEVAAAAGTDELQAVRALVDEAAPFVAVPTLAKLAARLYDTEPAEAETAIEAALDLLPQIPATVDHSLGLDRDASLLTVVEATSATNLINPFPLVRQLVLPPNRAIAYSLLASDYFDRGQHDHGEEALSHLGNEWRDLREGELSPWLVTTCATNLSGLPPNIDVPKMLSWVPLARQMVSPPARWDDPGDWARELSDAELPIIEAVGLACAAIRIAGEADGATLASLVEGIVAHGTRQEAWPRDKAVFVGRALASADLSLCLDWLEATGIETEAVRIMMDASGRADETSWSRTVHLVLNRQNLFGNHHAWYSAMISLAVVGWQNSIEGHLDLLKTALVTSHAADRPVLQDLSWIAGQIVRKATTQMTAEQAAGLAEAHFGLTDRFR